MEREEGKKEGRGKYGRSWGWQEIIFLQATTAMEHPSLKSLAEKKNRIIGGVRETTEGRGLWILLLGTSTCSTTLSTP